jgi:hypothetical protein
MRADQMCRFFPVLLRTCAFIPGMPAHRGNRLASAVFRDSQKYPNIFRAPSHSYYKTRLERLRKELMRAGDACSHGSFDGCDLSSSGINPIAFNSLAVPAYRARFYLFIKSIGNVLNMQLKCGEICHNSGFFLISIVDIAADQ